MAPLCEYRMSLKGSYQWGWIRHLQLRPSAHLGWRPVRRWPRKRGRQTLRRSALLQATSLVAQRKVNLSEQTAEIRKGRMESTQTDQIVPDRGSWYFLDSSKFKAYCISRKNQGHWFLVKENGKSYMDTFILFFPVCCSTSNPQQESDTGHRSRKRVFVSRSPYRFDPKPQTPNQCYTNVQQKIASFCLRGWCF